MWEKEGPLCRCDPVSPMSPGSATMRLPRCLVLLASLVPPALGSWGVSYPESLQASGGSCLVVPCTFSYPAGVTTADGIVAIWYKDYDGQRTLVFHSATPQDVDPRFGGRAQLLGDPMARNCTLLLQGVTPGDSGLYRFRFEIINGDRWSASRDVTLSVSEDLERPSVTSSEEQTEGQRSTLECSTPYVCPRGDVVLRWEGYDPQVSEVSSHVQLDTSGVSHQVTLTSSFTWKDHSKKLLCKVSDGSKSASTEVVLRVRHAPKDTQASLSPSSGNIGVGDTVTLSCQVGSSHPPVSGYHWYKDGVAVGTERVLALRGVRREDHGRYHCEAQNALGTGASPPVTLRVFSAEISASPAAEVREGTATTLSCDVPGREGHPEELTYTWYKNSAWLKEGPAHTLLFPAVAAGDAGYYSCQVTNSQGSDTAQAISLSVTYPPRIPTLTLFQETQGGRLVIVRCTVDSHPPATLAIDRDGTVLATSGAQVALGQRLGVTASRNSLRLEIRDAGSRDSGKYGCTASNVHGNASATKVLVTRAAGLLIQPSAEVTEGTAVTLTCVGTGDTDEEPLYTWYRNGRRLQESSSPTLEFPSVRGDDAGAFQCQVRGRNGSDTSEAVPLRVLYPPRQPVLSSFLQSQGGRLGIIQCSVESDPESNLTLRRGDDAIACTQGCPQATGPRVLVTRSYNSLKVEIRDVVVEDEGIYVCQAGNSQGSASATVDFKADTANVTVSPSPHVLEGDNATLTCHLSSGSTAVPNVTWYHNGQQISTGSATSLVLRPVVSRDTGLYRCQASTAGGSRSSPDVLLDVLYPPRDPLLTAFLEAEQGSLAIFQCSVASNPPAQLALLRDQELVATSAGGSSPRVTVSAVPNSLRVEVREVTPADDGSYRCTATNAHGSAERRLYLRVQATRVLISPSSEVLEGDNVSLMCQVAGEPPGDTVYSWYKDSKWLQEGPDSVLVLSAVTSAATGLYHCRARGSAGTSVSPAATLRVCYPPRVPVLSTFLEPPSGQRGILECSVDSSPPAQLALFKDGALVASTALSPPVPRPRLSVTSATNALRVHVHPVLLQDEGEYRCVATNAHGNASATGNFSGGAARVWIWPSPDVREGDTATLTCAVAGGDGDVLSYTWYRNQVWLGTGSSQNLTFPGVTASDAGSYHCSIRTPAWNHSATPATLSVLYPPRNLRLQSFVESSQGTATILLCAVDSHPPAQLTLLRGGHPVASSPPRGGDTLRQSIRVSPSPNALRLEFREASEEDEGEYECQARSALGDTHASLTLRVQATRVLVRPSAEVAEGTEVTLTCQAPRAQPGTLYTWFKNGRWVTEGPEPSLGLRGHRSDAGLYACRAGRGPRAPPVALAVLYAPQEPSFVALVEPRGGRQAVLLCSADGVPPPDIAVSRGQGHPPLATSRGSSDPRFEVRATPTSLRVGMAGLEPRDAGLYLCSATNSRGSATASLRLEVPGVTLTVEPSQEVPEGTRATMSCSATAWGDKGVNYTWYRDGRWLWEGPSGSFVLGRVSSADAGSYQCRASGTWGTATSVPLSLSVLYPPRAVSVSTFLENQKGRGAIVLCTAQSHPPSSLALHHHGHLLATSLSPAVTPGVRATPSHNALRVELAALGTGAGGRYVCVATNALGNATASADFDVHTLSHLWTFQVLSGLLMAIVAITIMALLAMKMWPRIRKFRSWSRAEDTLELRSKQDLPQMDGAS
ncbi:LOW QUALITY PROTEIN: sialoadhesin [Vidua macroura]|uniref:LOW QUALITY PROTEIN: sialoadhesin n=1 Tax=Vidua macroura TaxID=187451 RepID=UPI0023A8926B|nr:LOW QUALITY PROTEIN: sialoadhesin [Vidua macroura]